MLYRRLSVLVVIALGISSCSKSDQSLEDGYTNANNGVSNIVVPPGVSPLKISPYYTIPSGRPQGEIPPSIQPPVLSNSPKVSTPTPSAPTSVSANPQKRLVLILPEDNAWQAIGHALSEDSRLKVVDQDESKRTYYILDTKKTSGEIKKKTPAYLVVLQPVKAGFLVLITDNKGNPVSIKTHNTIIKSIKGYLS